MKNALRLFAAIPLDEHARVECAGVIARLRAANLPAQFEPPEKLHVTLAFLGSVEMERVDEVQRVLSSLEGALTEFEMHFDKIGAFPYERRPRIVFVGCSGNKNRFAMLSRQVRSAFERIGFTFGKDSMPHVTIARIKGGDAHLPSIEFPPIALRVRQITLFESVPGERSSRYQTLMRVPLLRP